MQEPGLTETVERPTRSSARCGDWEARNGFRSTALVYVDEEELLRAFDRVGAFIYEAFLDSTRRPDAADSPTGMTGRELTAAARDLRHLVEFLGHVAAEREASELPPVEHRLAELAATKAEEIAAIAAAIEAAVEAGGGVSAAPARPRKR